jgi:hypothetical protein
LIGVPRAEEAEELKARLFRIAGSAGALAVLAFVLEASRKVPH